MVHKDVFTAADLPPNPFTLETARTPDEYISAFRAAHNEVSSPEQWVQFVDALRESRFNSTHVFGRSEWVMHELVPAPPDQAPHVMRTIRHYMQDFIPKAAIAYVSLLHLHGRKQSIVVRNGQQPDSPLTYAVATKGLSKSTLPPSLTESEAIFAQFDHFLKAYRFPTEIAHSTIRRLT